MIQSLSLSISHPIDLKTFPRDTNDIRSFPIIGIPGSHESTVFEGNGN